MDETLISAWTDAVSAALNQVWMQLAAFLPALVGGLVIFIAGLIVASVLGHLVERALNMVKVDALVSRTGINKEFERSGVMFSVSRFFGRLTYWFFLVVTVIATVNILFPSAQVATLLAPLLAFVPNVIAAVIIVLGSVVLANFLRGVVRASVVGARLHASKFLGTLAWWAVIVSGFLAALSQLNIGSIVINTLITGVIAMLAIAGGIAFGLGGKEYAAHLLARFREQVEK